MQGGILYAISLFLLSKEDLFYCMAVKFYYEWYLWGGRDKINILSTILPQTTWFLFDMFLECEGGIIPKYFNLSLKE